MDNLKKAVFRFVDHIGDVIGAIMITVIIAVLFVREHSATLFEYRLELYVIIISMILVHMIAPLVSPSQRHRRTYILGFAHLAWAALVALSGANDSLVVLISMGLIVATSLWLSYGYIIASAATVIALHLMNSSFENVADTFNMVSYLVVAAFLIERNISRKAKRIERSSKLNEATVERQRMQALVNSMTDCVIATDDSGSVVLYNASALDLLNINVTLERRNIKDFLHLVDSNDKAIDVFSQAEKARAYFVSRDLRLRVDDDEYINVFISMSPVRIGYGAQGEQGYVILMRDITKEKSLEEERDEFISVVSHELRTPITIAEGNISNLKVLREQGASDENINAALNDAHTQIIFLSDMINDLATLSRAERGKLQVDPETIDTVDLLQSLHRDYQTDAAQKHLSLELDIDEKAASIYTSRLYLREILQNFITNAIKYTQKGKVVLRLLAKDDETVVFEIEDSGIGISQSDQKKLFQKFFRSEDYRTRENNGTGLGLYVTLKLAKIIGATIDVESQLDKGSTFRIVVSNIKDNKRKKPQLDG